MDGSSVMGGSRKTVHKLVDHQSVDVNLLALHRTLIDLRILLVKESDEFGTIVTAIALCCEDKSETDVFNIGLLGDDL